MVDIDEAHLKAELTAIRKARRHAPLQLQQQNRSLRAAKLAERQGHAQERLLASLAGGDGGVKEFEAHCARTREEMRRTFEKQRDEFARDALSTRKALNARLDTRRRVALAGAPNFNFVVLDTPLFILPTSGIDMAAWNKQPWNNTAKISGSWNMQAQNDWEELDFVFVWRNPSSAYAVVNVASYLRLNGFCDAWANGGFLPDNWAGLGLHASLNVYEWWTQPPALAPDQPSSTQYLGGPTAAANGLFDPGTYDSQRISGAYDVTYREFILPPQGVAVFEVSFGFLHLIFGSGIVDLDFASGDFDVMCPAVVIGILT